MVQMVLKGSKMSSKGLRKILANGDVEAKMPREICTRDVAESWCGWGDAPPPQGKGGTNHRAEHDSGS
jgi:hypothetical protein